VKVTFYATLRRLVGDASFEVALPEGATVGDLLEELVRRWPALRDHLLADDGGIPRRVNVCIDGRSVRWLPGGNATVLTDAAVVDVFPPVAGG
jgi:molybdopterin synthase sulfur carrier subunit